MVGSHDDAEDLCSETFQRAWRAWPRYRATDAPPRAWLLRIARNLAADRGRRQKLERRRAADAQQAPNPEVEAMERLRLRAALARVPARERELLALRAAGLSHQEIASVIKKSEGATRMAWHRAMLSMRRELEAEA